MACFQGRAEVLGAHLCPSALVPSEVPPTVPAAQDASKTLGAIHSLLAAASADSQGQERAPKRRKIDECTAAALHSVSNEQSESVVLARICLDLVGTRFPLCSMMHRV